MGHKSLEVTLPVTRHPTPGMSMTKVVIAIAVGLVVASAAVPTVLSRVSRTDDHLRVEDRSAYEDADAFGDGAPDRGALVRASRIVVHPDGHTATRITTISSYPSDESTRLWARRVRDDVVDPSSANAVGAVGSFDDPAFDAASFDFTASTEWTSTEGIDLEVHVGGTESLGSSEFSRLYREIVEAFCGEFAPVGAEGA